MSNNRITFILTIILIISLFFILWQKFGMNRELIIPLGPNSHITFVDDKVNGGKSESSIKYIDSKPTLISKIIKSSTFPFSSLSIPILDSNKNPVDLSVYDQMEFVMNYQSDSLDTIIVYLVNSEIYSNRSIERFNMTAIIPKFGKYKYVIDLDDLYRPSWWLYAQRGITNTLENISNVHRLQITSGDNTNERIVKFSIESVVFKGKWISSKSTYIVFLGIWFVTIFIIIIFNFRNLLKSFEQNIDRSKSLEYINKYLIEEKSKFEDLALRDSLTNCFNRHGLEQIINELKLPVNKNKIYSIIIFDIDHFKLVNDEFGHDEGDIVLRNLAFTVQSSIRDSDYFIRWGGEEFIIICKDTVLNNAIPFAHKLCKIISESELSSKTIVTASFGVASLDISNFGISLTEADKKLLEAKNNGRNRVNY